MHPKVAVATLVAVAHTCSAIINITIPPYEPKLARIVPKSLVGISIEMDRWIDWSGPAVGEPNKLVNQLLGNLANYTGQAVPLRVGGESCPERCYCTSAE